MSVRLESRPAASPDGSLLRRLPIESPQPAVQFAAARAAMTVLATATVAVLDVASKGRVLFALGAIGIPWTVGVLLAALRRPQVALHPALAAGDFAVLALVEVLAPETYGAVRFAALFLVAVHAHLQGDRRGLAVAAGGVVALVVPTAVRGDAPASGALLAYYEVVFALCALATGLLVGRLRTAESASRLRARRLSRRTIQLETEVRRRVAESIHDGPVQELIGLDMLLSTADRAAAAGEPERARELIRDARELAGRNVQELRDEIVDLGPYAFEELGFETAIENCMPVWKRRYRFQVLATIERVEMPPEMAGDLFRIAQEAVVNAGRHANADTVSLSLRTVAGELELRVTDDGDGFGDVDPLAPAEFGHLGLATMRERAELMNGRLEIESSERGTRVLVRVPAPVPGARSSRAR